MDAGMLSQDEINALLNGMDVSDDNEQDAGTQDPNVPVDSSQIVNHDDVLTDVEKDAIGEVANISMGSSATTLYSLVNRRVNITTPVVELATWDNLLTQYERPCVFIQIKYTVGLDGTNILILKEHDVKVITDLMMGGDGTNTDGELGELHLSAISEAMNQMMGASATSLSTMLQTKIDISPPDATLLDLTKVETGGDISPFLGGLFVKISFRMQIDDLVDSSIMQLYPVEFARKVVNTFISSQSGGSGSETVEQTVSPAADANSQTPAFSEQSSAGAMSGGMGMNPQMGLQTPGAMDTQMMGMNSQMGMNPQMGMMNPQMGMMNPQMMQGNMGMATAPMMQNVNAQPAQFQSFTGDGGGIAGQENIGKFVAKGEVVVIEESFSVRVTDIIK